MAMEALYCGRLPDARNSYFVQHKLPVLEGNKVSVLRCQHAPSLFSVVTVRPSHLSKETLVRSQSLLDPRYPTLVL